MHVFWKKRFLKISNSLGVLKFLAATRQCTAHVRHAALQCMQSLKVSLLHSLLYFV